MGPAEFATTAQKATVTPSPEQVRSQVEKVLASPIFVRSERISRFLRFAVEHALAGSPTKEYLVGVEVFDRAADYDPRVDPIVRVEARRLRAKLKTYYGSEKDTDQVVIEFPKGAYTPIFRLRDVTARPDPSGPTAMAVLPFANLSPASEDDYFSDGLAEELILLLTRVEGLRVVAWSSASQFRGREQELSSIRENLKAGVILRGSVRRAGGRVRATAQLIDTATGSYLWSEAFDRSLSDVVSIQQEIARAIVETLRLAWRPAQRPPQVPKKLNLECYNLCLQARFNGNRRTPEGLLKSVTCYEQAIEKDPESAVAYAGLADSYSLLSDYGIMHPRDAMPHAAAAAQKALELDPGSAEALSALAFIRSLFDWKWTEAEALYVRAIAINPSYSRARHWFGVDALALLGRFDEAEAQVQAARESDPLSLILHEGIAYIRLLRRDYDGANQEIRHLTDLDPAFYKAYTAQGRVFSLTGKYHDAIAMFEKAITIAGDLPSIIAALGQTLALAGERRRALECLDQLNEMARGRHLASSCFAILYLGLGDVEMSLTWLERACDQHESQIAAVKVHPIYDSLRSEPRFHQILRRVGFLP
ncbi:MAG: repeat-containing protein [Bryobacterales bacterium]|nr:repeat-containing protein [Bryobacterales bacterium]